MAKTEHELIERAVAGDRPALEELLLQLHGRLRARIARKLPREFQGLLAVEDVLQEAYVDVFRSVLSGGAQTQPLGGA